MQNKYGSPYLSGNDPKLETLIIKLSEQSFCIHSAHFKNKMQKSGLPLFRDMFDPEYSRLIMNYVQKVMDSLTAQRLIREVAPGCFEKVRAHAGMLSQVLRLAGRQQDTRLARHYGERYGEGSVIKGGASKRRRSGRKSPRSARKAPRSGRKSPRSF